MLCEIVEDHSPFYIKFKFNGVEDFFKKCRDELQNHKLDGGLPVYQRRIDELRADEFLNMLPFSNKINFQKHRLAYIITKPRSSFPIHIDKASVSFNFGIDIKDEHCITRWFSSHDIASNYRSQGPDPHNRDIIPDEEWNRVQIEPINLGGVQITYATGFNGAFINDNKIGVGSTIELIRSGDVIPYIRKVIVPADSGKMPSVPFKWNDTHIDVLLEDIESDETVKEKNITGFFKGIGVEGLSTGNVKRIMDAGYDSVPAILKMTIPDFLEVDGFKEKTATKLYEGIREKIDAATLVSIMSLFYCYLPYISFYIFYYISCIYLS